MVYYAKVTSKGGTVLYRAASHDRNALEQEMDKVLIYYPDAKKEISDKPIKLGSLILTGIFTCQSKASNQ